MKKIKVGNGLFSLVDDEDYLELMRFRWRAYESGNNYYVVRNITLLDGRHSTVYMHRQIMNTPDGLDCDHINHNGLDNQKHNLRNCTRLQNMCNRTSGGKSVYLGVSFLMVKGIRYIRAQIQVDKKNKYLGYYPTEELAALAYDAAAKKYHGEFAHLNFG